MVGESANQNQLGKSWSTIDGGPAQQRDHPMNETCHQAVCRETTKVNPILQLPEGG